MGHVRAAGFHQSSLRNGTAQHGRIAQGERDVLFQGRECALGQTGRDQGSVADCSSNGSASQYSGQQIGSVSRTERSPRCKPGAFLCRGWLSEHQQRSIEYLVKENRILREQIGDRKLRFTDNQRRRLAVRAKELSRSALNRIATIVTPETLLAWEAHRKQVRCKRHAQTRSAANHTGGRSSGRPNG